MSGKLKQMESQHEEEGGAKLKEAREDYRRLKVILQLSSENHPSQDHFKLFSIYFAGSKHKEMHRTGQRSLEAEVSPSGLAGKPTSPP